MNRLTPSSIDASPSSGGQQKKVVEFIDLGDSDESESEDEEAKAILESYDVKCNEKLMKSVARIKAENKALAARLPALIKEIEKVKSENKQLQIEKKKNDAIIETLTKLTRFHPCVF